MKNNFFKVIDNDTKEQAYIRNDSIKYISGNKVYFSDKTFLEIDDFSAKKLVNSIEGE